MAEDLSWMDEMEKNTQGEDLSWMDEMDTAPKQKPNVSYLESFGRGMADMGSLGFADELTGLVEGGYNSLTNDVPFGDAYTKARDESRAAYAAAEEANPKTSFAGQMAGGLATLALPGGVAAKSAQIAGKSMLGAGAIAAAEGSLYGLGGSEADLTKGEYGQAAKDTLTGGAIGGVLGAALQPVTKLAGAKIAEMAAERQSRKAAANYVKVLNKNGKWAQEVRAAGHNIDEMGRTLSDYNIMGLTDDAEKMFMKTDAALTKIEQNMDDLIPAAIKNKVRGVGVDDVIAQLRSKKEAMLKAGSKTHGTTPESTVNKIFREIEGEIEKYRITPQGYTSNVTIPLDELRRFRSRLSKRIKTYGTEVGKGSVTQDVRKALSEVLEGAYAKAGLKDAFTTQNKEWSKLTMIKDILERKKDDIALQGGLMPSIMPATGSSLLGGMFAGPLGAIGFGAGMLAVDMAKKHGHRGIAATQKKAASIFTKMSKNISKLTNTQQQILRTAAQRGPNAIVASHFMLSQQSPEYRKKMMEE